MSSHGTAHTLRALEAADSLRRELKRDYFKMEVDGVHYEVHHEGGRAELREYTPQPHRSYSSRRNNTPRSSYSPRRNDGSVGVGQRWNRGPSVVGIGKRWR